MRCLNFALLVLIGIAAASSSIRELNSTELGAVLIGAGPIITEVTTTTEYLAVIPSEAPYHWGHVPLVISRISVWPMTREYHVRIGGLFRDHTSTIPPFKNIIPQPTITGEPPKATEVEESIPQCKDKHRRWITDLDALTGIPLITPTWTVSKTKWYRPYSRRPDTTLEVRSPAEKETLGADPLKDTLAIVTPSAFNA